MKQIQIPYIGAVYELANRVMFIFSAFNFLMVSVVTYTASETVRHMFSSFWLFLLMYALIGILTAIFSYVVIIPSQNKFAQEQAVIEGRSPLYEKVCDIEKKIEELRV